MKYGSIRARGGGRGIEKYVDNGKEVARDRGLGLIDRMVKRYRLNTSATEQRILEILLDKLVKQMVKTSD